MRAYYYYYNANYIVEIEINECGSNLTKKKSHFIICQNQIFLKNDFIIFDIPNVYRFIHPPPLAI